MSFGDGSGYTDQLTVGKAWETGLWTAATSRMTPRSDPTESLPNWLKDLGVKCQERAKMEYGDDISISSHTFDLAVCNYYTKTAY